MKKQSESKAGQTSGKTIEFIGAQGDVLFQRIAIIPAGGTRLKPEAGRLVVAHSETGHHHSIAADGRVEMFEGPDPFTCYLRVATGWADVVHQRPFDTHEPVRLGEGTWMVRRQREYVSEGFRRLED